MNQEAVVLQLPRAQHGYSELREVRLCRRSVGVNLGEREAAYPCEDSSTARMCSSEP